METLLSLHGESQAESGNSVNPLRPLDSAPQGHPTQARKGQTRCQDPVDGLNDPETIIKALFLQPIYYK